MLKILKYLFVMFIANIILSTLIYSLSPLKIGNRADIITFMVIVYFFTILFLVNIIMYVVLHYVCCIANRIILILINLLVLFLILNEHAVEWKNPYLLICTPVYFVLQFFFVLLYNRKNADI
jgi:hypothetical protein